MDKQWMKAFLQDQRGSVLAVLGFGLVMATGFTALAVDMGYLYVLKGRLQTTADFAVMAAVAQLPDENSARTTALDYAAKNMPTSGHGNVLLDADVATGNWDASTRTFAAGGNPVNAVQVVTRRAQANGNPAQTFFARALGFDQVDVDASAIASNQSGPICVLALDPSAKGAFDIDNRTYTANNCSIHVNSDDAKAITGKSGGLIDADSISIVGGYGGQPTYSPIPHTGSAPIPDPLASLAAPTVGPCTVTNYTLPSGDATLDPGVYCGGITTTTAGTLTLNPGTYIIKDGEFKAGGGANIVGAGVHIFLTGTNANMDLVGGGQLSLSAPTTGEMAGILIYADRNMDPSVVHSLKGGTASNYEGVVYMPSTGLRFAGVATGGSTSAWAAYIARIFTAAGQGELVINYVPGASTVPLPVGLSGGGGGIALVK